MSLAVLIFAFIVIILAITYGAIYLLKPETFKFGAVLFKLLSVNIEFSKPRSAPQVRHSPRRRD